VRAIDVRIAELTLRLVEPLTEPKAAVIDVEPTPVPVIRPPTVTVATAEFDELQLTELVRLTVLPFVYVPVAVNCWLVPLVIEVFEGVTAMETKAGGFTVRVAVPVTPPDVALIVVLPVATVVARPVVPTVATLAFEEAQVGLLIGAVVPLLYVPVAVNCCVMPSAADGLAGVTAMDVNWTAAPVPCKVAACCPAPSETVRVPLL
jgi:hypothetical protein